MPDLTSDELRRYARHLVLRGVGGHAARPHWGNEVLVAACAVVSNLQTIVSRRLSPT